LRSSFWSAFWPPCWDICWAGGGWRRAAVPVPGQVVTRSVLVSYWPLIALTLFGYLIQLGLFSMPSEQLMQRTPTGTAAILKFFGQLKNVSMALSALMYFRFRSRAFLLLFLANFALFLPGMVLEVKRTQILTVFFVIAAAYWLSIRKEVPKTLIVLVAPVLLLLALAVGQLRAVSGVSVDQNNQLVFDLPTVSEILAIDWAEVARGDDMDPSLATIELRNAIAYKEIIDRKQSFDLGAQFWNRLIQIYVPGSLVGADTKEALKIGTDLYDFDYASDEGYSRLVGSTLTGFLQAYADFWFLGAMIYLGSGFILGRLYRRAHAGMILQQVVYLSITIISLNILTHDSYRLLVFLPMQYAVAYVLVRSSFRAVQVVVP
jgi:hypothetical protein